MCGGLRRYAASAAIAAALAVGALVRLPWLPQPCHSDVQSYTVWSWRMLERGLGSVYCNHVPAIVAGRPVRLLPANIPVGALAAFYVIGRWLYPGAAGEPFSLELATSILAPPETAAKRLARTFFKLPAALVDLLTAGLIGGWVARRWGAWHGGVAALLYAIHPAVLHVSVVWGQIDAWHMLGMTLAVRALHQRRYCTAAVFLTAALLFKFQAIMLAPLVGSCLLLAPARPATKRPARLHGQGVHWGRGLGALAMGASLTLLCWLPWLQTGAGRHILDPYTRTVGQFHYATVGAFNGYWLLQHNRPAAATDFMAGIDDRRCALRLPGTALGLSYEVLGILGVLVVDGLILGLVGRARFRRPALFVAAPLHCLAFFLLAPEMHERYLLPLAPLLLLGYRPTLGWWAAWLAAGTALTLNVSCIYPPPDGWLGTVAAWAWQTPQTTGELAALLLIGVSAFLFLGLLRFCHRGRRRCSA